MSGFKFSSTYVMAHALFGASVVFASTDTIGPNGINSAGLLSAESMPLTGSGIALGQIDVSRPGDPNFDTIGGLFHTSVEPAEVFFLDPGPPVSFSPTMNDPMGTEVDEHAVGVAGVIISTDTSDPDMDGDSPTGVAPGAALYAAGTGVPVLPGQPEAAVSAQHVAMQNNGDVRAINMSFGEELVDGHVLDGNSLLTQFIDWSARQHNVLYVKSGNQDAGGVPVPSDNFNGITVAASNKVNGVYRQVATFNNFAEGFFGLPPNQRTFTDLLAPGENVKVTVLGDMTSFEDGTSIAAPHVTGTVALLQEYAEERIMNAGGPRWTANARQHEVMKAVLLNSADKIEDDGTRAPVGSFLGMERTVVDTDGTSTWLDSTAFNNEAMPLALRMGAGHLNASRALQQFSPGEFGAGVAPVPLIGWDYGSTTGDDDIQMYVLAQPLRGGSYISATLVWDREVLFDVDGGTPGVYDIGDTFIPDCCFTDLDLYLMPAGAASLAQMITRSRSGVADDTREHIFFEIPPAGGQFEIWVHQASSQFGLGQDYALAWWAAAAVTATSQGDYNGDGEVNAQDYIVWKSEFGAAVTPGTGADGNGNGIIDAADYTIWRDNLGAVLGSASFAAVPEPGSLHLALAGLGIILARRRRAGLMTRSGVVECIH